jgi:hypothetical protein
VETAVGAARMEERCHYIFHIGHVGSTLLSRLMGADPRVFALREPPVLRMFARLRTEPELQPRAWDDADFERHLGVMLKLLSRTFRPEQTALVKATSYVSELAPELLARPSAPKAVFLSVRPESYFATILAGPNARAEAKGLTAARLKRLHHRLGREVWRLGSFGEGEGLALAWAAEMAALADAAKSAGDRVLWVDFDDFLAAPQETLARILAHFDCAPDPRALNDIVSGPLMQRYSKAPDHAYSAQLRRELLDEARKAHAPVIAKGLEWLDRANADIPLPSSPLSAA